MSYFAKSIMFPFVLGLVGLILVKILGYGITSTVLGRFAHLFLAGYYVLVGILIVIVCVSAEQFAAMKVKFTTK